MMNSFLSKQVNAKVVRINAALTILFLALFILTPYKWIILLLAGDFLIRGFFKQTYSPFCGFSKTLLRVFNVKPRMVSADSKIFAAKLGFFMCCILIAMQLFGWPKTGILFAAVFLCFAALEAAFGFCMACKIYPFVCRSLDPDVSKVQDALCHRPQE